MTNVSRTFVVEAAPDVVIDYLKDFSHAEAWDPGTESCSRIDDGEIRVGSQWHNTSKIAGVSTELVYELTELRADSVTFVGENDTAKTTDVITATPHGTGTELTYDATIDMKGAAKLGAPAVKLIFEKVGNDTEDDLTRVLNQLA